MHYRLIRSNRSSIGLHVNADGELIVRAPSYVSISEIETLIIQKQAWITAAQTRLNKQKNIHPVHQFVPGEVFWFLGKDLILKYAHISKVTLTDGLLYIPDTQPAQTTLETWYKKQARSYFSEQLNNRSASMQIPFGAFRLSGARTCWGSCGPKNSINLTWRLIMAQPAAIDYVIVHELCHILHRDHSRAFWDCVQSHCPDAAMQRAWLKEHQGILRCFP